MGDSSGLMNGKLGRGEWRKLNDNEIFQKGSSFEKQKVNRKDDSRVLFNYPIPYFYGRISFIYSIRKQISVGNRCNR